MRGMASVFGFKDQEVFEISFPVIGLIAWGAYLVFLGTYRRTDLVVREKIDTLIDNCPSLSQPSGQFSRPKACR